MKKLFITIFTLTIALAGCSSDSYTNIGVDEYNQMITEKDKYTFIDVRTPEEYETDGLKDIFTNIDSSIAADKISSTYNKDTNIVLVCRSGNRSSIVANDLVKKGFSNVYNIENGLYSIL